MFTETNRHRNTNGRMNATPPRMHCPSTRVDLPVVSRFWTVFGGMLLCIAAVGRFSLAAAGTMPSPMPYADPSSPDSSTVTVQIDHVLSIGDGDGCGDQDFYAKLTIDGETVTTPTIGGQNEIYPANWEYSKTVVNSNRAIPISIALWEEDGGFCGGDDHMDIRSGAGQDLGMTVDPRNCQVAGDVTGVCSDTLVSAGTDADRARIWFRINATPPPSGPGLTVFCLHDPIWPTATDTVVFTAEAYDENGLAKRADALEIWVNQTGGPLQTCSTNLACQTTAQGPYLNTFSYGCRVRVGTDEFAEEVWSGWRTVQVGPPRNSRAVPVIYTGARENRVDILFVADQDYVGGATGGAFLRDVHWAISQAFYRLPILMKYQDRFNFWIAQDPGDVAPSGGICPNVQLPANWNSDYAFPDSGALLHRTPDPLQPTVPLRDCANRGNRYFTANFMSISPQTIVRHEAGHQPFGLADEYCCDGGYFENHPLPNLYDAQSDCMNDTRRPGIDPGACGQVMDWAACGGSGANGVDWFRLDPLNSTCNDLMSNGGDPQRADRDRIEWFLERCKLPNVPC